MNPTIVYISCSSKFFTFLVIYRLMLESEQVEGKVIKSLHIQLNALKEPL